MKIIAVLFEDRAQSVACLAPNPEIIEVAVKKSNDALVLSSRVFDVDIAADLGGFPDGLPEVATKQRVRAESAYRRGLRLN